MADQQQLPSNWVENTAAPQLTKKDSSDPGGDLITAGLAKGTYTTASLTAAGGVISAGLVAVLSPFKTDPTLAIAAAVIIAVVALSAALVIAADLTSRAQVTSARMAAIGSVIDQAVSAPATQTPQPAPQAGAPGAAGAQPSPPTPSPTPPASQSYTAGVPLVGFDVSSQGDPDHLLAVAWTPTSSDGKAPSGLLYLVAQEGSGQPVWKAADQIYGVQRVKLEPPPK
jgi:hypothetical protein